VPGLELGRAPCGLQPPLHSAAAATRHHPPLPHPATAIVPSPNPTCLPLNPTPKPTSNPTPTHISTPPQLNCPQFYPQTHLKPISNLKPNPNPHPRSRRRGARSAGSWPAAGSTASCGTSGGALRVDAGWLYMVMGFTCVLALKGFQLYGNFSFVGVLAI